MRSGGSGLVGSFSGVKSVGLWCVGCRLGDRVVLGLIFIVGVGSGGGL